MELFSSTIQSLERALNYSTTKHKVIAHNIANAEVPNYKAKDVSFKDVWEEETKQLEMRKTNHRHLEVAGANGGSKVFTKPNYQYHDNGNNVDLDKEMSDLATNQIYYQALIERLNGNFATLSNVIKGGR